MREEYKLTADQKKSRAAALKLAGPPLEKELTTYLAVSHGDMDDVGSFDNTGLTYSYGFSTNPAIKIDFEGHKPHDGRGNPVTGDAPVGVFSPKGGYKPNAFPDFAAMVKDMERVKDLQVFDDRVTPGSIVSSSGVKSVTKFYASVKRANTLRAKKQSGESDKDD